MQVLLGASARLALGDLGCKSEARIHVPLLWISFTIELHLAPGWGSVLAFALGAEGAGAEIRTIQGELLAGLAGAGTRNRTGVFPI